MSILQVLRADGSIVVNKFLAQSLGLDAAIILSELIGWHTFFAERDRLDDEGMFFCTVDKLEENTTLSEHQQRKAVNKLEALGLIKTKRKGLPAKRYFTIDEDAITQLVIGKNKNLKKSTTDNDAEKCTSAPEKPRRSQSLKKLTTGTPKNEELHTEKLRSINTISINTNLEEEDSNIAPVVAESYSVSEIELEHQAYDAALSPAITEEIRDHLRDKFYSVISDYKPEAIRQAFKDMKRNITGIKAIGPWLAKAIVNAQVKVDQARLTDEELAAAREKYGF